MSTDPRVIDMAARIDDVNERIERLETLEYETTAFPAGPGALALLCDVVMAVDAAAVTLCPAGAIPGTFSHLWLVISCRSDREIPPKLEMTVNGDVSGSYSYYVREEFPVFAPPVGGGDTEAIQPGGSGAFDLKWQICHPGADTSNPPDWPKRPRNACMVIFSDYADATMYSSMAWFSYAHREIAAVDHLSVEQGGGRWVKVAPITSITITHPAPGVLRAGSQFTLYGL